MSYKKRYTKKKYQNKRRYYKKTYNPLKKFRTEWKCHEFDFDEGALTCSTAGQVVNLIPIATGVTQEGRIGDKVVLRSLKLTLNATVNANLATQIEKIRVIIGSVSGTINDAQTDVPNIATNKYALLNAAIPESMRYTDTKKLYKVYYDKVHMMDKLNRNGKVIKIYKRFAIPTTWDKDDSQVDKWPQKGGLFLMIFGTEAVNYSVIYGTGQVYFTDN